jgi:outer membrane protein assembly factor BamB
VVFQTFVRPSRNHSLLTFVTSLLLLLLCVGSQTALASPSWTAKLDGRVRFYQPTELGVLVVGTEKSLYVVDGESGEVLWRRKDVRLDETDVAPVPGTDILLLNLESGSKTRFEAADLMTGDSLWRSEKVRGAVMQMAFQPRSNLLAVILARDARGRSRGGFKRRPAIHMFDLTAGRELWKRELESEVEMMPARWADDDEVPYTLDNYRPPLFMDDRLYLFYEGLTSLDARTGKERKREKFRVNEEGLALTDADPVVDESAIYVSGRGRVRSISRITGEAIWEAKDLGAVPELVLARTVLYVRTGGQFTRLENGETVERGPYGVSAINIADGKVLWRYKGADKGITNIELPDTSTVIVADRDDLILLDAATGKRRAKISHGVERPGFVLLNERSEVVVGGVSEIAGFQLPGGLNVWRSRHDPPGRGVFRTVAAVAARAASLYFQFGGPASTAFRGAQLLSAASSLRWSGLAARVALPNLTSLATNYGRDYVGDRIATFGVLSRLRDRQPYSRASVSPGFSIDVEERLLDRLDPARQLEKLSRFLWRRRRLATLRGQWMYFYTETRRGNGLVGVSINTGLPERTIAISAPDERFISDEEANLLFVSQGNRLLAYPLDQPAEH